MSGSSRPRAGRPPSWSPAEDGILLATRGQPMPATRERLARHGLSSHRTAAAIKNRRLLVVQQLLRGTTDPTRAVGMLAALVFADA